jgi:hypothetical protein
MRKQFPMGENGTAEFVDLVFAYEEERIEDRCWMTLMNNAYGAEENMDASVIEAGEKTRAGQVRRVHQRLSRVEYADAFKVTHNWPFLPPGLDLPLNVQVRLTPDAAVGVVHRECPEGNRECKGYLMNLAMVIPYNRDFDAEALRPMLDSTYVETLADTDEIIATVKRRFKAYTEHYIQEWQFTDCEAEQPTANDFTNLLIRGMVQWLRKKNGKAVFERMDAYFSDLLSGATRLEGSAGNGKHGASGIQLV